MLEQELASIIKFIEEVEPDLFPYYYEVPQNFAIPAVYYPVPEIITDGETFSTYGMDYSWYIKFFHKSAQEAYSIGQMVLTAIRANRNRIPLIMVDGSKNDGICLRVNDPKLIAVDDGIVQLSIRWRSRRPYKDVLEETQHTQSFNYDIFMKSSKRISDEYAETFEQYAVLLNFTGRKPGR